MLTSEGAISHMWQSRMWNVARVTEEPNFKFNFINLNINGPQWLVAAKWDNPWEEEEGQPGAHETPQTGINAGDNFRFSIPAPVSTQGGPQST